MLFPIHFHSKNLQKPSSKKKIQHQPITTRTIFGTELTSGPPAVPPQSKLKVPAVGAARTERGRWPGASAAAKDASGSESKRWEEGRRCIFRDTERNLLGAKSSWMMISVDV